MKKVNWVKYLKVNEIIHGDCLEVMKTFENDSIDCVITSPPYYQLRDYGWTGQWGLEKTYQEYLDKMIAFMAECKRILKPTGTIWINLGDSYSTNSGSMGTGLQQPKFTEQANKVLNFKQEKPGTNKSLMLIPHRFAIRCIDELGLILRNDIIWAKRNGMPESVTDRFSKKHEFFFLFVKSQKYYFDLDGVRDDHKDNSLERVKRKWNGHREPGSSYASMEISRMCNPNGKNPGDVADFWDVNTKPSKANHYATFNSQLIDKPIIAGCPKGGVILDPFCGTGTTLKRALELERKVIGIDGKLEYAEMSQETINNHISQTRLFETT